MPNPQYTVVSPPRAAPQYTVVRPGAGTASPTTPEFSGAGGSFALPVAQTARAEDVLRSYAPGFVAAHPTLTSAISAIPDALQGGGRELIGQGIRLAKLVSPRGGAALQRIAGDYATPIPGAAETVGRIGTQIGEFAAPGGVEEKAAGRIGEALAGAPKIVRGAAKLIPSAAASGGITGLQGGNPLAGAALGAAAEGAGQAIKAAAPGLAESAAGITPKMRKFGRRPGRIILDYTRGIRPATVARTAEDAIQDADATRTAMAQAAEREPVVVHDRVPPQRLALPAAPPERVPVPLHEATATVEKASPLQPAMVGARAPITARGNAHVLAAPEEAAFQPPEYRNATAMENGGARKQRSAAYRAAVNKQNALAENNGSIFVRPGGTGKVSHPMTFPLNTVQETEPAQGVWLRTPEGEVVHVPGPPVHPEDLGFRLTHPNTISRVPAENAAGSFADTLENRFHEEPGAARGIHAQVQRFPEHMTPSEAVDLSRAMGRHIDFGKMPGVGHPDSAQAAIAARFANERQLEGLLGPEFGDLGNREGALIAIKNAMLRRELGPGIGQRLMERGAARTGALASAILGGEAAGPVGAITAPILQELSTMPAIRMGMARGADVFPSVVRNVGAPVALTFASNATRK